MKVKDSNAIKKHLEGMCKNGQKCRQEIRRREIAEMFSEPEAGQRNIEVTQTPIKSPSKP